MRLEEEYEPAYTAWKTTPTPATAGELLKAVDPVLNTAMRTYSGGAGQSPTLRSRAKQLAVQAFDSYDPQRGSMRNHLLANLQRLRRYAAKEQQAIAIPEQIALDRQHLDETTRELEDDLGRPPSDRELTDRAGISDRRLAYLRQAQLPVAEGTLMQSGRMADSGRFAPAVQSIAPQASDPWVEMVYDDASPIDQYILERSLGLHGHAPQSATDIAKSLRLSSGAISQRMQKLQQLLDQREELGVFGG